MKNKFTLVELLVVIAIIAILSSMLMPTLGKARSVARNISCVSNLRQIAQANMLYASDNDEFSVPYNTVSGMGAAGDMWMGESIGDGTYDLTRNNLLGPYLGDEYGVMMTLNNNKKKSLTKTDIILNFDFPQELINKYRIAEKAIIINFKGNVKIKQKRFEGKIFNDYDIILENPDGFEDYANNKFYTKDIYEALIYKHQPIENIMRKIEKDRVKIIKLLL